MSCYLKSGSVGLVGSVGTPPLRVIAFGTTVLRAPWTDFNNFWFFGKFRASSGWPDGFLVFLNQTCLFQNQISKMSYVFLLYLDYIQATRWSRCRCLRLPARRKRSTRGVLFISRVPLDTRRPWDTPSSGLRCLVKRDYQCIMLNSYKLQYHTIGSVEPIFMCKAAARIIWLFPTIMCV